MPTNFTTNAEIKAINGISGTTYDAMIMMWNRAATELLCSYLQVSDLVTHTVIKELLHRSDPSYLVPNDFPVNTSQTITLEDWNYNAITGYTFTRNGNDLRRVLILNSSSKPSQVYNEELFMSYTAGFTIYDTVTIADDSSLANKTLIVENAGTETTYTFVVSGASDTNIVIGVDETATAAALAAKITGATSSGTTVTFPLGYRWRLGTATSSQLTIVNATMPQDLKMCICLLVGGFLANATQKKGGVVSYSLGTKNVTFKDITDKNLFISIVEAYAPYKRTQIKAI